MSTLRHISIPSYSITPPGCTVSEPIRLAYVKCEDCRHRGKATCRNFNRRFPSYVIPGCTVKEEDYGLMVQTQDLDPEPIGVQTYHMAVVRTDYGFIATQILHGTVCTYVDPVTGERRSSQVYAIEATSVEAARGACLALAEKDFLARCWKCGELEFRDKVHITDNGELLCRQCAAKLCMMSLPKEEK